MARTRSAESYNKILSNAEELFIERGYTKTRMQDIAKKSELSIGTVYSYFKDKKELLNSINNKGNIQIRPEYERKRKRILNAALMLFGKKGYAGVTMDEIASAVGFTKAALYQYCEGKEDLFSQVLQESTLNIATKELSHSIDRKTNWMQAVFDIGQSYFAIARTEERLAILRTVVSDSGKFPEIGKLYFERGFNKACENMANYLEDFQRDGHIRDVDLYLACTTYLGSLQSFIVTHYLVHGVHSGIDADSYLKNTTDIFCNGIKRTI